MKIRNEKRVAKEEEQKESKIAKSFLNNFNLVSRRFEWSEWNNEMETKSKTQKTQIADAVGTYSDMNKIK